MNIVNKLTTQPYKGARDFYPEDMSLQNYIYEKWKKVCRLYGFEQYDFPIVEPFEVFAAKSGEELVNEQLFTFQDKAGRKLALRPELTPGTVRMIAQRFKEIPQPIKWFMIGNNWRYEKPQMGRGREFYQLEANIFGEESVNADFEIFSLIIAIMKEFGATGDMYEVRISDRRLLTALLAGTLRLEETTALKVRRLMDKRSKITEEDFLMELRSIGLSEEQAQKVEKFLSSTLDTLSEVIPLEVLEGNEGFNDIQKVFGLLKENALLPYCRFDPSIIRGFDYSDKLVYEVFDKNPENRRSLFGGERFDGLASIFGKYDLPATGFAMGDYTLAEFLKGWKLIPENKETVEYFVTVWPSDDMVYLNKSYKIAETLREKGKKCFLWTNNTTRLDKQLKYADKRDAGYVLILGEQEIENGTVTIKNMKDQSQETKSLEMFFDTIE